MRATKSLEAVFTEGSHERSTERSEITIERATKRATKRAIVRTTIRTMKGSVNVSIANLGLGLKTAQRLSSKRFARRSDLDLAMRPVERKVLGSKSLEGLTNRLASE